MDDYLDSKYYKCIVEKGKNTTFAQDVIRCSRCDSAMESRCILCKNELCKGYKSTHLCNKRPHFELVTLTHNIKTCSSHEEMKCEIFCRDCDKQICVKCVTSIHRTHDFMELEDFLKEKRNEILAEIKEFEDRKLPEIQRQTSIIDVGEYEDVIEVIFQKEEEICSAVRNFGSKLRENVTQHEMKNRERGNKIKSNKQSILKSIHEAKALAQSNNYAAILQFNGLKLSKDFLQPVEEHTPQLEVKCLKEDDIASLFGRLVFKPCTADKSVENKAVVPRGTVEEKSWFHGFIPRKEAESLLQKRGDFLVRESEKGAEHCFIVSSFRKGPSHIRIRHEDIVQKLGQSGTVVEFIEHLQHSSENMIHPIPRQNSQLQYDKISMGSHLDEKTFPKSKILCQGIYCSRSVLVRWNDEEGKGVFENLTFLRQFKHHNIVNLIGFSALRKPVLLVMEHLSGGSLLNFLRKNGADISVKKKMEMCGDVASGMAYLQEKKCIHRDVAARNCLVSADTVVKISDFWMAELGKKVNNSGILLPIKWTAPEALDSGFSTSLSDVWSFGILMWEIFSSGQLPYTGMNNNETIENIQKGYRMPLPHGTPKTCYNLMLRCWNKNPSDRHNFDEIVNKIQKVINDY